MGPGPWCREVRQAGLGHFFKLVKKHLQLIFHFLRRIPGRNRHRRIDGLLMSHMLMLCQGQIDTLGQRPTPVPGKEEMKLMTRWPSDFHLGVREFWPLHVSHAGRRDPRLWDAWLLQPLKCGPVGTQLGLAPPPLGCRLPLTYRWLQREARLSGVKGCVFTSILSQLFFIFGDFNSRFLKDGNWASSG